MEKITIQHVSDTALWVAYYRFTESQQAKPLFNDPFAGLLIGGRGKEIAESMKETSKYTRWSVVTRTHIIDNYIESLVKEGIDAVINLGTGLDTRPYRMNLPKSLHWIEVDFPHVIEHKQKILKNETPRVQLERISLDLSSDNERRKMFADLGKRFKKVLILTEGVLPYLSEDQVAVLARDLKEQSSFRYWIAEYFSADIYRYFKRSRRMHKLKNAPFVFFPHDWFKFFADHGWQKNQVRYLAEESQKLGRPMPMPWWTFILKPFLKGARFTQQMGYVIFKPLE